MREKELIVYRDFEDGELLYDMAFLMSHYDDEYYNTEDMAALFYECIHDLIDLAGNYGFPRESVALLPGKSPGEQREQLQLRL